MSSIYPSTPKYLLSDYYALGNVLGTVAPWWRQTQSEASGTYVMEWISSRGFVWHEFTQAILIDPPLWTTFQLPVASLPEPISGQNSAGQKSWRLNIYWKPPSTSAWWELVY